MKHVRFSQGEVWIQVVSFLGESRYEDERNDAKKNICVARCEQLYLICLTIVASMFLEVE